MAWRTTEEQVREIIDTDVSLSIAPFIDQASALTDKVSAADTTGELGTDLLLMIEKNLAAHFYAFRDPQYTSKSTGGASGSFQGQTGLGLNATYWGQTAMLLDVTGYLTELNMATRPKASLTWLGKPPSEQTDYEDRD
jgi:hypothetical protein